MLVAAVFGYSTLALGYTELALGSSFRFSMQSGLSLLIQNHDLLSAYLTPSLLDFQNIVIECI